MIIKLKDYNINATVMSEDEDVCLVFRDLLLFYWLQEVKILNTDSAVKLSLDISELQTICGMGDDDIIVDYDTKFISNPILFSKPHILVEFIKWLKNKRIDHMRNHDAELSSVYTEMISEIE